MNKTDEFSFRLKASNIGGVGVFALHDIDTDVMLALKTNEKVGIVRHKEDIPNELIEYCIANQDGTYTCPPEFNHMHLVWYLNHSNEPNATLRENAYHSTKPIKAGEEIVIDYNILGEPEDKKEAFYGTK